MKDTGSDRFWVCMCCFKNVFPFATINNHKLHQTLTQGNSHYSESYDSNSTKICSTLKTLKNLSNLFNEFNNFSSRHNKNTENINNCKYYKIDEIQNVSNLSHKHALSYFHINACSLCKNIEELEYPIKKTKFDFAVIGISESRIKKDNCPINSRNLKDYSYEFCKTEPSTGGTLLYISNHLSYKTRSDLRIYKSSKSKSISTEILDPKKTDVILGCSYHHLHIDLDEFYD